MQLTHITLRGTMQGPIWWPVGEICETEFSKDFAAPKAPHSPWQTEWSCLDDALLAALDSGDFQGGMGDIVSGEMIFHLAGNGRTVTISKPLEEMKAAADFLAPGDTA